MLVILLLNDKEKFKVGNMLKTKHCEPFYEHNEEKKKAIKKEKPDGQGNILRYYSVHERKSEGCLREDRGWRESD